MKVDTVRMDLREEGKKKGKKKEDGRSNLKREDKIREHGDTRRFENGTKIFHCPTSSGTIESPSGE